MSAARLSAVTVGRVLVIGSLRAPSLEPDEPHAVDAPSTVGQLRGALAAPRSGPFDGALIAEWGKDVSLPELVDEVRRAVRPGGAVAFAAPVAQAGWRGARSAVLSMFSGPRPTPLEDLCGALLLGHLVDVRVRPIEGARGYAVVSAIVPPPWPDDVESSSIRPST